MLLLHVPEAWANMFRKTFSQPQGDHWIAFQTDFKMPGVGEKSEYLPSDLVGLDAISVRIAFYGAWLVEAVPSQCLPVHQSPYSSTEKPVI